MLRLIFLLTCITFIGSAHAETETAPAPRVYAEFDLTDYLPPREAKSTSIPRGIDNRQGIALTPYLGVQLDPMCVIAQVDSDSPAAKSGLKTGDTVVGIDGTRLTQRETFRDLLLAHAVGDKATIATRRNGKDLESIVTLASVSNPLAEKEDGARKGSGWDNRLGGTFRRSAYKLAVILVEFPDLAINGKISPGDWEQSLFSKSSYLDKSVTGQPVFGSMNDYYLEQSCGQLRVEGKVFDPVKVSKKRTDYASSTTRSALLSECVDLLRARDKDALRGFDGLCYIYAGDAAATQRSSIYWPHRAGFTHKNNERFGYFVVPEGGTRMSNISTICHEFGHMLGLPDLYAKPEVPGMEGVGSWCAMSQQNRGGRPQHFCAWSKEQLGWIKPTILDPAVPQKLILEPINGTIDQCFKVLIKADGSEYLLLENRSKTGFDKELQGEGLLIWHVTDGRPLLEESHGIAGPAGPRAFPTSVPYPSKANASYTPYTIPSSKAFKPGGKPVHITNIRRLPDGKIAFQIGFEYY